MNGKKILLVDDEKDTLLVMEKQLNTAGYKVVVANSGPEALLLAKSEQPDIIVLDVQMPGMDGGEVAFRLEQDPMTENIPVVYSTCLLPKSEDYRCGKKIMLAKTNDGEELIAVINETLSEE